MRDARDRAAACFPRYFRERMDELGCDVSVIYPSTGLAFLQLGNEELRRAGCRALNRYHRDAFEGCTDRLIPVAAVPAHTPQEAIHELEYAVLELGFRAVVIPTYIPRPVPGFGDADDDTRRWAFWADTYGIDSDYDYDPFWQRCLELGVSIGTHTQGNGIGFRRSTANWVYNHIGHFAASGEALCKSLFLGGVTRRFPGLRVGAARGRRRMGMQPLQRSRRALGEAQHPCVAREPRSCAARCRGVRSARRAMGERRHRDP